MIVVSIVVNRVRWAVVVVRDKGCSNSTGVTQAANAIKIWESTTPVDVQAVFYTLFGTVSGVLSAQAVDTIAMAIVKAVERCGSAQWEEVREAAEPRLAMWF